MKKEVINKQQKIILKMLYEYSKLSKKDKEIFTYYLDIFFKAMIKSLREIGFTN